MAYTENSTNGLSGCLNHYTVDNIETWFMVEEDDIEVCDRCDHLVYKNGIMTCDYLDRLKRR